MKTPWRVLLLLTALSLLTGCAGPGGASGGADSSASVPASSSSPVSGSAVEPPEGSAGSSSGAGVSPEETDRSGWIPSVKGSYAPPDVTDLPPLESPEELEGLTPGDFGVMEETFETEHGSFVLLEGTDLALTVHVLRGQEEGPLLYVVGGVHGDELAGWYAGTVLKNASVRAGTVCILAPANTWGAENVQRETAEDRDLNRNFPGDPEGTDTEKTAAAIFEDIRARQPAFVLDLHEGRFHDNGQDNLGNSIICGDINAVPDLVLGLLEESKNGTLTTRPLDVYSSPPAGSLNQTVTDELGIPVITAETYREEPLPARVRGQLRLAEYIMKAYGLR